jgi:hypothetical protein
MEAAVMDRPAPTTASGPEAGMTVDAVAETVIAFKSEFERWKAETGDYYGSIEARLRRERAMGAMLIELKDAGLLHKGGRPPKVKPTTSVSSVSLEDLGITPEQSSRWQLEARVPQDEFDTWIEKMKASDGEISSAALRRLAMNLGLCSKSAGGPEFPDVDTSVPDGPCAACGRSCGCTGEQS